MGFLGQFRRKKRRGQKPAMCVIQAKIIPTAFFSFCDYYPERKRDKLSRSNSGIRDTTNSSSSSKFSEKVIPARWAWMAWAIC